MISKKSLGDVRRIMVSLAARPISIRHLPRMLRSMGKKTIDLREAWLPYDLMDRLDAQLTRSSVVFEYGGGGSTAWFADRVGSVTTVEHEPSWYGVLESTMSARPNVRLLHRGSDKDFDDYVSAIDDFPDDSIDVIVVDGRERIRCFEHAIRKVRPGGILLLDDAERPRYSSAFSKVDWPREVVRDFAPCKATLAHTAVFSRPTADSVGAK